MLTGEWLLKTGVVFWSGSYLNCLKIEIGSSQWSKFISTSILRKCQRNVQVGGIMFAASL